MAEASRVARFVAALLFFAAGCDAQAPSSKAPTKALVSSASATPKPAVLAVQTRWTARARVVAVGDLHGDIQATRRALTLALVLKGEHWSGGETLLVQTGDVLDRGDEEPEILELLDRLEGEARAAGGELIALNGNHELMNAAGDFRYVTPGGFADFHGHAKGDAEADLLASVPPAQHGRAAAFFAGGYYAQRFAKHPVIAVVGDTVFVHGGLLSKWARDPEALNAEVSTWLAGGSAAGGRVLTEQDSPVWSRRYAENPDEAGCAELARALTLVGAKRMVVGHTVMKSGIAPACDERLWRIDVGLAAAYGGKPAVLELSENRVRVLSE